MQFAGKEYDGKGVKIALIDSGINQEELNMPFEQCMRYSLALQATNHVRIAEGGRDVHGHGTKVAKCILGHLPKVELLSIQVTDAEFRVGADLLAAGIELAYKSNASIIHVSMGTSNMGRALLLRDICVAAREHGAIVVASAHPKGERTYPADIPEVIGVSSNQECRSLFHFPKDIYPKKQWKGFSNKFLAPAYMGSVYGGVGCATAYVSSFMAMLTQAFPEDTPEKRIDRLANRAFWPTIELGYDS